MNFIVKSPLSRDQMLRFVENEKRHQKENFKAGDYLSANNAAFCDGDESLQKLPQCEWRFSIGEVAFPLSW